MDMTPTPFEALKIAVDRAGGQSALARFRNVSQAAVSKWVHVAKRLPAEHVLGVEAATGVSRHWLRPDIYPLEVCPGHVSDLAPTPDPGRWNGVDHRHPSITSVSDRSGHVTFANETVSQQDDAPVASATFRAGAIR